MKTFLVLMALAIVCGEISAYFAPSGFKLDSFLATEAVGRGLSEAGCQRVKGNSLRGVPVPERVECYVSLVHFEGRDYRLTWQRPV